MTVPAGLLTAHDHARDELRRADGKATSLLSVVGAALAGVIALTGRPMPVVAVIALWVAAVPILVSVVTLLSVIRPSLHGAPAQGSWLYAAGRPPATVLKAYTGSDGCQPELIAALDLSELAAIARDKFQRIARAVRLLTRGLLLVVLVILVVSVALS
jgi:pycsar effector protein